MKEIERIKELVKWSDAIVLGAGAGLSTVLALYMTEIIS